MDRVGLPDLVEDGASSTVVASDRRVADEACLVDPEQGPVDEDDRTAELRFVALEETVDDLLFLFRPELEGPSKTIGVVVHEGRSLELRLPAAAAARSALATRPAGPGRASGSPRPVRPTLPTARLRLRAAREKEEEDDHPRRNSSRHSELPTTSLAASRCLQSGRRPPQWYESTRALQSKMPSNPKKADRV